MNKITIYQHEREPKIMFYIYEGRQGCHDNIEKMGFKILVQFTGSITANGYIQTFVQFRNKTEELYHKRYDNLINTEESCLCKCGAKLHGDYDENPLLVPCYFCWVKDSLTKEMLDNDKTN